MGNSSCSPVAYTVPVSCALEIIQLDQTLRRLLDSRGEEQPTKRFAVLSGWENSKHSQKKIESLLGVACGEDRKAADASVDSASASVLVDCDALAVRLPKTGFELVGEGNWDSQVLREPEHP